MAEQAWGSDVVGIREKVYSLIRFSDAPSILDIGCGNGSDLIRLGEQCSKNSRLTGIDSSAKAVEIAAEKIRNDPRFTLVCKDVSTGLPFDDGSFDIVYSMNLLECVLNRDALLTEVYRVLRPGGQVIFGHWDWDTQVINGTDKQLIRQFVAAFSDWKQGWMQECDGWMGRRMAGTFQKHGGFSGGIIPFTLVNAEYIPGLYGFERIRDFKTMAEKGIVSREDHRAFQEDIERAVKERTYFYSITLYVYSGIKKVDEGPAVDRPVRKCE